MWLTVHYPALPPGSQLPVTVYSPLVHLAIGLPAKPRLQEPVHCSPLGVSPQLKLPSTNVTSPVHEAATQRQRKSVTHTQAGMLNPGTSLQARDESLPLLVGTCEDRGTRGQVLVTCHSLCSPARGISTPYQDCSCLTQCTCHCGM